MTAKKPKPEAKPDPFARWVDDVDGLPHGSFCHCGTCQDAMHAAMRMYEQMTVHDCELWAMQVAAHLHAIAGMGIVAQIARSNRRRDPKSPSITEPAAMICREISDGCKQTMTENDGGLQLVADMFNRLNRERRR